MDFSKEFFADRLRSFREQNHLTQRQLAIAIGSDERVVQNYELKQVLPSSEKLIQLADALGITLDELVGRTPPEHKHGPVKVPEEE